MHCFGNRAMRLITVLAILGVITLSIPDIAAAQIVPGSGWSEPINLSNSVGASQDDYITADQYGNVHVFWAEDTTGKPVVDGAALAYPNAILYRSLRNGVWSEAVDLAFTREADFTRFPTALVDPSGVLHLVWIQLSGLYYRHVPVGESGGMQAWSPKSQLVKGDVKEVQLIQVGDRILCLYFINTKDSKSIYASYLTDDPSVQPYLVWSAPYGYAAEFLSAAIDGHGRIHLVWQVYQPPITSGLEVRYSYSEDGGATWSRSRLVAQGVPGTDTSVYYAYPWVGTRGNNEIHIQWAQGSQTYRWHEYSTDGGQTWSQAVQLWPNLLSQTNSRAVGVDSENNLYWADVLRYPNGIYLMRWTESGWLRPDMGYAISSDTSAPKKDRYHTEFLRMTITSGNQMHMTFLEKDIYDVFYMHRTLPAREIPSLAMPTAIPTATAPAIPATSAATEKIGSQVRLTATIAAPQPSSKLRSLLSQQGAPLYLGILPVILVLLGLLFGRYWKRR